MPFLTVGGVIVPVAPGGGKMDESDATDRRRAFDNTYRASVTGTAKRDFRFSTPPILLEYAEVYKSLLRLVGPLICSGDFIQTANLLLSPVDFDNAVWSKVGSTIGINSIGAPDGSTTADKLEEDGSTGLHNMAQGVTRGLDTYAFSTWVKAAERTGAVIALSDNVAGGVYIGVNLTNGTTFATGVGLGSWTATSSVVTAYANGWYHVKVTGTRGAGAATAGVIEVWNGARSYAGSVGSGIYAWGARLIATSLNCYPELIGSTPVKVQGVHREILDFALHEA